MRAIHLYCDLVSSAVLDGLQAELAASGVDIGARAEPAVDDLSDEETGATAEGEGTIMPAVEGELASGQPAAADA
jgi:small subunit ribosomal protein S2